MEAVRFIAQLILFFANAFILPSAVAQTYPDRPIRFIAGYPPGSASDNVSRILSAKLAQQFGQQIVVDNRPGAAGNIAAELTAKSPPDGYTMLLVATNHAIVSSLYKKLSFDPVKDFACVSLVSTAPTVLVVHPSLPVRSVADLISLARKHPGKMNYASSGSGASPHLNMELFKNNKNLNITHIPYKGVPQALTDLIGGQIDMMFSTMAPAVPLVKAGRLRALAVSGSKRSPALPDVPTMAETIPGFVAESWQGVLVPAGTPDAIIDRINRAIINALQQPDVSQKLIDLGFNPVGSTPQEFSTFLKSEILRWSHVVKASGASVD